MTDGINPTHKGASFYISVSQRVAHQQEKKRITDKQPKDVQMDGFVEGKRKAIDEAGADINSRAKRRKYAF